MSQLSHPIKVSAVSVAYPDSGPNQGYAVLHATGCSHLSRRNACDSEPLAVVPGPDDDYSDDYYEVAPCARKARSTSQKEIHNV